MSEKILNVVIKLRRETEEFYDKVKDTFIPVNGEVCLVDSINYGLRTKVGDGTKKYSALPFTDEVLRNLVSDSSKPAFYFEGTTGADLSFIPTSTVADLNTAYEANRPCYCFKIWHFFYRNKAV